ncbi:ROK family transcriptional regulator [Microbacterium sp. SA39]|uniref:ROK family transcriptional regulator n=1 Tax=Microbacterium sp. SA39 TaxID=1263625 RepID=UPI0005FA7017|nr:ROK family transcriptional regulator [Microbacterium sp. SA39]KJQ54425.1 Glucokinase [Microbacterium sp. SA39]
MTPREKPKVRELNLARTLREIRAGSETTISQLVGATGLSRPSVNSLILQLTDLGWVETVTPTPDGLGGRPPQRYRFNAGIGRLVGLDIGVHRVSVVVTDLAGEVIAGAKLDVDPDALPDERLVRVDEALDLALAEAAVAPEDVWSVGAAVTGAVDAHGRTSMFSPMPGWGEVDLIGHLASRLSCPVRVENDVKLALLAEHAWGAVRGAKDVAYVLAGQRTGAASMVNGQLVRGHGGAAGEIGALPAVHWRRASERLLHVPGMPESLRESERAAWTFEQAQRADPVAKKVVRKYARDVATGAAAVALTLDPEIVVIGGGSAKWANLWLPEFSAMLNKSVVRMPEVRVSTLGGDHVARGAVRMAMTEVERRLHGDRLLPAKRPAAGE